MAGCALPTQIEQVRSERPPVGALFFVVNYSKTSINKITFWRTFILGWDPDYQMALAERDIKNALALRHRLSEDMERAKLILRIDPPRRETDGVFEEIKVVSVSSGQEIAVLSKKGDNWDQAVQVLLDWVDQVPGKGKGGSI